MSTTCSLLDNVYISITFLPSLCYCLVSSLSLCGIKLVTCEQLLYFLNACLLEYKLQVIANLSTICITLVKYTFLFTLKLKCHTFIGLNMARDCRIYFCVVGFKFGNRPMLHLLILTFIYIFNTETAF